MAIEIVDLPNENGGSFQFVMGQFTRPGIFYKSTTCVQWSCSEQLVHVGMILATSHNFPGQVCMIF